MPHDMVKRLNDCYPRDGNEDYDLLRRCRGDKPLALLVSKQHAKWCSMAGVLMFPREMKISRNKMKLQARAETLDPMTRDAVRSMRRKWRTTL